MQTHLKANDLWEAVKEDYEVLPLLDNLTLGQIRIHKERKARNSKAKASLFAAVSQESSPMKSAFEIWHFLRDEYGDEKMKNMQVLNLDQILDTKMKDSKTIKNMPTNL